MDKNLFYKLTRIGAVTGDEFRLSLFLKDVFSKFTDDIKVDKVGNVIMNIKGKDSSKKVAFFTHIDEPGFIVKKIDKSGYLFFDTVGDVDIKDLASQEVYIWGKKEIPGVIGLKPPHILTEEEERTPLNLNDLVIDTGMSKEDLCGTISIGTTATVKRDCIELYDNKICSRALGDRVGIIAFYDFLSKLKQQLPYDLSIAFLVQHYNDHIGAKVAVQQINPDIALVVDSVSASDDKFINIKKGPVIYSGPSAHQKLTNWMLDYADTQSKHFQIKAASGKNPTDAWAIQIACGGIPTAIMLVPIKYLGKPTEVVSREDLHETSELISGFSGVLSKKDWRDLSWL